MELIDKNKIINSGLAKGFVRWDEIKYAEPILTIPKNPTNGDMIKAIFQITDNDIDEDLSTIYIYTKTRVLKGGSQDYLRKQITFRKDWWNSPYKKEV